MDHGTALQHPPSRQNRFFLLFSPHNLIFFKKKPVKNIALTVFDPLTAHHDASQQGWCAGGERGLRNEARILNLGLIRQENRVSYSLRVFWMFFFKYQVGLHVSSPEVTILVQGLEALLLSSWLFTLIYSPNLHSPLACLRFGRHSRRAPPGPAVYNSRT